MEAKHSNNFGNMQSPIDIQTASLLPLENSGPLLLDYSQSVLSCHAGHQPLLFSCQGNALLYHRPFLLEQFHFHCPSEHTVDGFSFAGEIHFLHHSPSGRLAVIGVFLVLGPQNPVLESLLCLLQKETPALLDFQKLVPPGPYYHYLGSLTTWPYSENVEWYLPITPLSLSAHQLESLGKVCCGNARQTQPLFHRPVLLYKDS